MNKKNDDFLEINSVVNPKIKKIAKLLKDGPGRQAEQIIIVDGSREIHEAVKAGWKIKEFFYCPDFSKDNDLCHDLWSLSSNNYILSKKVFDKISYKKNPDGYLAVLKAKSRKLEDVKIGEKPIVLVLESVEKPGNLGGIIRTAYAAGVDLIILNDQKTDLYSPNVIRASTGFLFSMPIVMASFPETISFLEKNKIQIFNTSIDDSNSYSSEDFKGSSAFVFGTEAWGISDAWKNTEVKKIKIPMRPGVDSLNVSVSVGIIVYEAIRQRKIFK